MYGIKLDQGEETGTLFSLGIPGVSYGGHFIHTLSTATLSPEEGVVNSLSPRLWCTWHNGVHVNSTVTQPRAFSTSHIHMHAPI